MSKNKGKKGKAEHQQQAVDECAICPLFQRLESGFGVHHCLTMEGPRPCDDAKASPGLSKKYTNHKGGMRDD